jgi:hypothetical protein
MTIYDFLVTNNKAIRLPEPTKKNKLEKFVDQFVDQQLVQQHILYWNSIKNEYMDKKKRIGLERLTTMRYKSLECSYIYVERNRELFSGSIQVIFDFLEQQEPWEETDIIVFDESYDWFIAFTHEDEIILVER